MARVYRHTYGGGRVSKKWYVEYRNAKGSKIREPAYVSKELSIGYLAECLRREELIRAGRYVQPAAEAALDTLLDRWHSYMQGRGFTARHCHYYRRACRETFTAADCRDLDSINAARCQDHLEGLIKAGKSNRTYCCFRSALLAFGNWLCLKEKLIPANPFTSIDTRNPDLGHRKIIRRVLTEAEFRRLLASTRKGQTYRRLTGETRSMLYWLAGSSGLRLGALCSLTADSFDLAAGGTVSVDADKQKNKRAHTIPLPADLVKALRKFIRGKSGILFPVGGKHGVRILRHDLREAGIKFRTEDGTCDFHSLRHYYGTTLARNGASVIEIQHLMGHSSPVLSSRYFGHLKPEELRGAVERLKS